MVLFFGSEVDNDFFGLMVWRMRELSMHQLEKVSMLLVAVTYDQVNQGCICKLDELS